MFGVCLFGGIVRQMLNMRHTSKNNKGVWARIRQALEIFPEIWLEVSIKKKFKTKLLKTFEQLFIYIDDPKNIYASNIDVTIPTKSASNMAPAAYLVSLIETAP